MATHKVTRGASKNARQKAHDRIYVFDPELEVRNGGLGLGGDKDIDVELKDSSGTCKAGYEKSSGVSRKHKVVWKIENDCGSDRRVKIVFGSKGSPLEPCTLEVVVKKGKKDEIKCKVRADADLGKYAYDLVVMAP